MATGRDIVKRVLRRIQVLGAGQTLDADEANNVLDIINDMLSMWSVEGNMVYTETKETFNLSSGTSTYTIGSGADFNTTRPTEITDIYVTQGSTDYYVAPYDRTEYAGIPNKTLQGTPTVYYYDAAYSTANLYLYPVPSSTSTITIYSVKPLTQFTDLDTVYALPPEYKMAIIENAAVLVAPEYEKEASPSVQRSARKSKLAVEAQNAKNNKYVSQIDAPASENSISNYDILRGY